MSPKTDLSGANLSDVKSVIFSCEGVEMTAEEKAFFKAQNPFGLILFARNVDNPDQVRCLISDFREAVGRPSAPVLVDQEGGRVQRLRKPHWFEAPAFGKIGALHKFDPVKAERALRIATGLIADDLADLGISVDCSPCLDLSLPETSSVIGDRSFDASPDLVSFYGAIVMEEFIAAGITPVIKHIPGHGRGTVDSHLELPVVNAPRDALSVADFLPFKNLSSCPWGMTAHIVFGDIDTKWPATQSPTVIKDIIRGEIGFDGVLLTDDLNMEALDGELEDRARRALDAGIDIVLHCSGVLEEMQRVAPVCDRLSDATIGRIKRAEASLPIPRLPLKDRNGLITELGDILMLVKDE